MAELQYYIFLQNIYYSNEIIKLIFELMPSDVVYYANSLVQCEENTSIFSQVTGTKYVFMRLHNTILWDFPFLFP